jgi:peptide/nickel transport system permease protein
MGRYVIRRLLWVVLVVLVVTMITFVIFFVMPPSDPAVRLAGKQPTPALVEEVRSQLGLDQPVWKQYLLFVKRLAVGDDYGWPGLGRSYDSQVAVRDELVRRAPVSFQLALGAAILWLVFGISIGIISALKRRTFIDRAAMGFALFGVSSPVFVLGLLGLLIFWERLGWLPGTGYTPLTEDPVDWFKHLLMPWVVLMLLYAAYYARMVRGNLLETLGEDYMRTARAKGLPESKVIGKHGLRASLTPVVTLFGIDIALLLGGAVITEQVFNIPGVGRLLIQAVTRRDYPVVQGVVLLIAFLYVMINLLVDILYGYLDPRIRQSRA